MKTKSTIWTFWHVNIQHMSRSPNIGIKKKKSLYHWQQDVFLHLKQNQPLFFILVSYYFVIKLFDCCSIVVTLNDFQTKFVDLKSTKRRSGKTLEFLFWNFHHKLTLFYRLISTPASNWNHDVTNLWNVNVTLWLFVECDKTAGFLCGFLGTQEIIPS